MDTTREITVTNEQLEGWKELLEEFYTEVEETDEDFLELEFPKEHEFCCASDVAFFIDLAEDMAGYYDVEFFWAVVRGCVEFSAEPRVVDPEAEAIERQYELEQDKEMF